MYPNSFGQSYPMAFGGFCWVFVFNNLGCRAGGLERRGSSGHVGLVGCRFLLVLPGLQVWLLEFLDGWRWSLGMKQGRKSFPMLFFFLGGGGVPYIERWYNLLQNAF